ncbi:hypothetical protein BHM03_00054915 [Ensete ventricosum]|nr:hypothetical protein BHM03_00054915 [Ensete ventricosum]
MVTVAASKMLTAASLAHRRPLTCRATASAATASRLVPHPSDLIRWVRREGGFVHPNLRIADGGPYGLGVVATNDIPPGSELIALPSHLLLRFDRSSESDGGCDGPHSTLVDLARRVPGTTICFSLVVSLLVLMWSFIARNRSATVDFDRHRPLKGGINLATARVKEEGEKKRENLETLCHSPSTILIRCGPPSSDFTDKEKMSPPLLLIASNEEKSPFFSSSEVTRRRGG